jgi:N-acylneuraminate cytidylyltransferase
LRLAVIPARGGSKRIPRKNIREFCGKPMISYPIACALASNLFDRVIVSTDDEEIASVAVAHGAEVPFVRPAAIADDHSSTGAVMRHAVAELRAEGAEGVCCIYATTPFLEADDLREGWRRLCDEGWDFVFAATSFAAPIHRAFVMDENSEVRMLFPEHFTTRSQDLPEVLHDAGQFYWGRPRAWLDEQRIFDEHSTVVRLPCWRVQDIDVEEDWRRAEAMATAFAAIDSTLSGRGDRR